MPLYRLVHNDKAEFKSSEKVIYYCQIPLSAKDDYYTVGYSFNDKGLYEILLDVNLTSTENALQLFQEINRDFQARFGKPEQEDESTVV